MFVKCGSCHGITCFDDEDLLNFYTGAMTTRFFLAIVRIETFDWNAVVKSA
jgi:hypothetical protein